EPAVSGTRDGLRSAAPDGRPAVRGRLPAEAQRHTGPHPHGAPTARPAHRRRARRDRLQSRRDRPAARRGSRAMSGSGAVRLRRDRDIATVRVGTGRRGNALATRDWDALAALFEDLADDRTLRAVILSGAGSTFFSAGSDMREWLSADPSDI